ncbi:MAG: hypothetical protein ABI467_18320 [Kofleriaceae bacterium]
MRSGLARCVDLVRVFVVVVVVGLASGCGDNRDLDPCRDACPPAPTATCDGNTVVTSGEATCDAEGTRASCSFAETRVDCTATFQLCAAGACVAPNSPCATTTCTTAPAATCSGTVLQTYDPNGTCDGTSGTGVCSYAPHAIDCAITHQLCEGGACVDPCDGVACTTPPAESCTGPMSTTYAATGTCVGATGAAVCHYAPTTTNCAATNGACDANTGLCIDPCSSVSCTTPPAASCTGTESTTYAATGTCDGTSGSAVCGYAPVVVDCAATSQSCDGATGLCTSVCVGVTCTAPPPPQCSGTTSISFAATGTCDGTSGSPVCSYAPAPTDCTQADQTCDPATGLCADPCTLTSCTTPPAASCTANQLTTYAAPGTCGSTGGVPTCSYAPTTLDCGAGFCAANTASCLADCGGSTCTTPPAATCSGDVVTSYAPTGTCDTTSTPTCAYAPTTTDCTVTGQTCSAGACTGPRVIVRTQAPAAVTDVVNTSQTVYGRILIEGVTDVNTGGNDALGFLDIVELGVGAGTDPTQFTYNFAVPNPGYTGDEPTYDEYLSTFTITGTAGTVLHYAYRLSRDGGTTWLYGDLGAAGSSDGFTTPGTLNIAAPFFSEYVEGSANTKAVEIYNPGSIAFPLNGCVIRQWTNAAVTPTTLLTFVAGDSIAANDVVTFCQATLLMAAGAPASCTKTTASTSLWNGNDTVELYCAGAILDAIGKESENPTTWGTDSTTTTDHTLLRHCDVFSGDTNAIDAFDPATQFKGYPKDTLTDLGVRTCPLP